MPVVNTSLFGSLHLLPFPAQVPVQERMTWKTSVLEAYDGTEQRFAVRPVARWRFSYSLPASAEVVASGFHTVFGARGYRWAIPLWAEAQTLGAVAPGLTSLSAVTDLYDFRSDSLALLWESNQSWQIIEIQSVGVGTLSLYGATQAFSRAVLLPVRRGFMPDSPTRTGSGYDATYDAVFEVEDTIPPASVPVPPQWDGQDWYDDAGLMSGEEVEDRFIQRVDVVDEELGPVAYRSPWATGRVARPVRWVLSGPEAVRDFRDFLNRRAGRLRAFFSPSGFPDLRLAHTGLVASSVTVWEDGYNGRERVAFQDTAQDWFPRKITGVTVLPGGLISLDLDTPLNREAADLLQLSYVGLKRLEPDMVELDWVGNGVAQTTIRILEIEP